MAKLIKSNGDVVENYTDLTLEGMQKAVNGYIEYVHCQDSLNILIVNEEGMLLHLPTNHKATEISGFPIVGDVILVKKEELY